MCRALGNIWGLPDVLLGTMQSPCRWKQRIGRTRFSLEGTRSNGRDQKRSWMAVWETPEKVQARDESSLDELGGPREEESGSGRSEEIELKQGLITLGPNKLTL